MEEWLPYGVSEYLSSMTTADTAANAGGTAEQIFGSASTFVGNFAPYSAPAAELFSGTLTFHIFTAVIFIGYCVALSLGGGLASDVRNFNRRLNAEKIHGEHNYNFARFISTFCALGVVTVPMLLMRYADFFPALRNDFSPGGAVEELMLPLLIAGLILFFGYRIAILTIVGRLTGNETFTASLLSVTRMLFALGVIVITPLFLLLAVNHSCGEITIAAIIAALVGVWTLAFIHKTFKLFVTQKVSILHWFLYLCGVEIMPLATSILLITRNN